MYYSVYLAKTPLQPMPPEGVMIKGYKYLGTVAAESRTEAEDTVYNVLALKAEDIRLQVTIEAWYRAQPIV